MSRASSKADDVSGIRDVSKTLSAERREKLLALRDRERMKDVLLEKFERRFGSQRERKDDDTQSVSESVLNNEVNHFVSKAALTEGNLARLERRMRQHARKNHTNHDDYQPSVVSAYSQASILSEAGSNLTKQNPSLYGIPEESGQYEWGKLDEYAKFLHERDEHKLKLGVVEQKKKLRTDLDKQIQDALEKKKALKEHDMKFHAQQMQELEKWKEVESKKEIEIRLAAVKEKDARDLQLRYDKQLRDEEAELKKRDEEVFAKKILNEVMAEKETQLKKKFRRREQMKEMYRENESEKAQKKVELEHQREQDMEYTREYSRLLDKQEKQKKAEIEGRFARQLERSKNMEALVTSVKNKQEQDDVLRAMNERKEIEKRLVEMEQNKAQKLTQLKLDTQQFLLQQMQEHDLEKKKLAKSKEVQAEILAKDSEDFNRLEKQEYHTRRQRNIAHRNELETQIEKRRGIRSEAMSAEEIAMNRDLLKKVDRVLSERQQVHC